MADQAPPALHELQAEIMEELWRVGEATVHDVHEVLNGRSNRSRAYTTVMTVMRRLHRRGVLDRRRMGRSDVYTPRLSREEYLQERARIEVDTLVAEYGDYALAHFAEQVARLDSKRRAQLQRLVDHD